VQGTVQLGYPESLVIGIGAALLALFPVYIALMSWGRLYLRDDRLRALVPYEINQLRQFGA
jgi:hypothetical protein